MKILVTGASGFIGQNLISFLVEHGHSVVGVDHKQEAKVPGYTHIHLNLLSEAIFARLQTFKFDLVIHLAAILGVENVSEFPVRTISDNFVMTKNVINLAKLNDAKFVLASSSEVYGNSKSFSEGDPSVIGPNTNPRWSYAISKLACEQAALDLIDSLIIRPFNVSGPGQLAKWVVPKMIHDGLTTGHVGYYGDGSATRCFIHVADFVEQLMNLVDADCQGIYNIGNPKNEISMKDLAHLIAQAVGADAVQTEGTAETIQRRKPYIAKLQSVTKWEPVQNIHQIIEDIAAGQTFQPPESHSAASGSE